MPAVRGGGPEFSGVPFVERAMTMCAICTLPNHSTDRCAIFSHPPTGAVATVSVATLNTSFTPSPPPPPPGPPSGPPPPPAFKAPGLRGAANAPAVKAPAVKAPAVKAPAVKASAVKASAVKASAVKLPAVRKAPALDANGLTDAEALAIFKYSDGGYGLMNRLLRNGTDVADHRSVQDISAEAVGDRLLSAARAMLKLPVWPGSYCLRGSSDFPVGSGQFRGKNISAVLQKLAAYYANAGQRSLGVWSDTAFISTTIGKEPFHTFKEGILWVLVTKGVPKHAGRDIKDYAKLKGEAEVTFVPGSEFEVLSFVPFDSSAHGHLIKAEIWGSFKWVAVLRAVPQHFRSEDLSKQAWFAAATIRLAKPEFQQ
jgi:hypothetical protein